MQGVGRRPERWWLPLVRWTLLAGVLAGLFGMHVLTAETAAGDHGALPHTMTASSPTDHEKAGGDPGMVAASGQHAGGSVAVAMSAAAFTAQSPDGAAAASAPSGGQGAGHSGLSGCVLFLVIGGALMLLTLLASGAWTTSDGVLPTRPAISWLRRRGPPGGYRPRVALCVIRV